MCLPQDLPITEDRNVAIGKPATQSSLSIWSTGRSVEADASIATSGDPDERRFFHTAEQPDPWWQVDLGDEFLIKQIRIRNRPDQPERLRHFSVLTAFSGEPDDWFEVYRKNDDQVIAGDLSFAIDLPRATVGRYVRIRLDGTGLLHFCQCEVVGSLPTDEQRAQIHRDMQESRAHYREQLAYLETTLRDGRTGTIEVIEGKTLFVDAGYAPAIIQSLLSGVYEGRERQIIPALLRPDDRVLEIGTAIGLISMIAADIVGAANVLTYDANPAIIEDARRNFAANGQAAILESFGRRRRTKVLEERTRGPRELRYGDFGVRSPLRADVAAVWRSLSSVGPMISALMRSLPLLERARRLTSRSALPASSTAEAVDRRASAPARGRLSPCRVMG